MTSKFGAALSKLKKVDEEPEILKTGKEENQTSEKPEVPITRKTESLNTGNRPDQENLKTREEVLNPAQAEGQVNQKVRKAEKKNSGFQEKLETRIPEIPISETQVSEATREKYSTILDRELVTRMKMYAVRNRLKDREVVEAALRAYLPEE